MRAGLRRTWAVLIKELIQMRRDRLTFAMIIGIPVMQLILFGFAINLDPKHLPTAVYAQDRSPLTLRMLDALKTSRYFDLQAELEDGRALQQALISGRYAFIIRIPEGFTRRVVRQEGAQLVMEADASDPAAAANALAQLQAITDHVMTEQFKGPLAGLAPRPDTVTWVVHRHFNPEGVTQYNIVPGLLGVILTMTMVLITSIAMTREQERGTMENLLALPPRPLEVMIGKIAPYILVGLLQTGIVLLAAHFVFNVPFTGSRHALALGVGVFILANLAVGFLFSTLARSQMQAMQMTFFFFLPSILLSGFMFPFRGMPHWAQVIGEVLPLTHFLRIVRGVMLKGADIPVLWSDYGALALFMVLMGSLALLRYRTTLD
ncbi:MAG: ABC transporter permease [Gammaproteobacteria bacterium]|nr:MAG: ABC transporter permease [Gammaproteobacteria bacterium]